MGIRAYLALGVLIAFLGLGGIALWYREQAISAAADAAKSRAELSDAKAANKAAVDTITALQEQARMDNKLAAAVLDQVQAIRDSQAEQSAKLDNLEKDDAAAHDYLGAPVPDSVCRLYNRC